MKSEPGDRQNTWIISAMALTFLIRFAAVVALESKGSLIPDEMQYRIAAREFFGGNLESLWPGYGASFNSAMWSYVAPLGLLFEISELWASGRLLSCVYASLSSALIYLTLRALTNERLSRVGFLVFVFLPSNFLWSIVMIREAQLQLVFSAILYLCVLIMRTPSQKTLRSQMPPIVMLAFGVWALCFSRAHSIMLVVGSAFLLMIIAVFFRHSDMRRAAVVLFGVTLLVTLGTPTGPLGLSLVTSQFGNVPKIQQSLGVGASSSFTTSDETITPPLIADTDETIMPPLIADTDETIMPPLIADTDAIDLPIWEALRNFPERMVSVMIRPNPFEDGSLQNRVAGLEGLLHLFFLIFVGTRLVLRGRKIPNIEVALWAFLVVTLFFIFFAVTQGNAGTAFRHRSQLMPFLLTSFFLVLSPEDHFPRVRRDPRQGTMD